MARRNKFAQMRETNRKQREERAQDFAPIEGAADMSGLDRHGDGFDVVVSDDDPEVAADLAAKTEELEAAAAEAVSSMETAQPSSVEIGGGFTPVPGHVSDETGYVLDEAEPQSEPEVEPQPEPKPAPKKKARPAQDPTPTPMTGEVTEKPQPQPTVMPEQLAAQERRRAMLGTEISAEIAEKFTSGEYEEDLAEFRAEQRVLEDEIAFLRMKERERQVKLEAAKWKTILVVKNDDGKWQFLVDAWKETTEAINLVPGINAKTRALMKEAATEDLYQRSEARQRHKETGEVRRYESRDLADLKKEEWRQKYGAAQAKKANPAGEARK